MLPFRLSPLFKPKPWGGRRLATLGKPIPEGPIGESWEVADLPPEVAADGRSRIATGTHAGLTLRELIDVDAPGLLGSEDPWRDGNFPLLVKILDAAESLSVQVHPDEAYAARHPSAHTKSESWYVIAAEESSVLFSGLLPGVGLADLEAAVGTSAIVELVRPVPAVVGEVHDIPAGTIHALGEGVMVAEVQTPSDTTFRLYDWSAEYGREPRPLHPQDAIAATHADSRPEPIPAMSSGSRHLLTTPYYSLDEAAGVTVPLVTGRLTVVMAITGTTSVGDERLRAGDTIIVPASSEPLSLDTEVGRALTVTLGVPDAHAGSS